MSGEAGGVIIGGGLLVAGLPLILAGVAVTGAAMGIASVAKSVAEERARQQERDRLAVENASAEMTAAYRRMNAAMEQQNRMNQEFYQKMTAQMEQLSQRTRTDMKKIEDTAQLDRMLRQAREETSRMMNQTRKAEMERMRRESQKMTDEILADLRSAQSAKMEAVNWEQRTAAAEAQQKAIAGDLLRDALASVKLLETLSKSSGESVFRSEAEAMRRSYDHAAAAVTEGNYQAGAASAQRIISRSASLSLEYQRKLRELDELRDIVRARLEGLKCEMESQHKIQFTDKVFGPQEQYLDDFTQGEYGQLQERIQEMLDRLSEERSPVQLRQMEDDVENKLVPDADRLIRTAYRKMQGYYERLHALQVISDYMKEQGYSMEWAQPAGDDMTQKLVVNFREPLNNNTISVSMDEDASAEDIERMAMEVMFYYANGRPVTEAEKESVRTGMVNALKKMGLDGSLKCTGSVNQEAADKTMSNQEAVRTLQAHPILMN